MLIERLEQKNPKHKGDLWLDYDALYQGGEVFRERVQRFLSRNPQEPQEIYRDRCRESVYRSYIGTVVDYFAALLFASPVLYGPEDDVQPPEWQEEIAGDCDGKGTDLCDFFRDVLVEAMIKRTALVSLEWPENYGEASDKAQADATGASDVRLRLLHREQVIDWKHDRRGKLLWAISREEECPRETPDDDRDETVITWWVMDRERVRRFRVALAKGQRLDPKQDLRPDLEILHGLDRVPIVELDVGPGLWIANRCESAQLEHFRLSSANNWSIRRTCYAMPVFQVENPEDFAARTMGAGYFLAIGKDEQASWMAPPVAHLAHVADEIKSQKDEIFRLVSQMSLGVDNNSASIGRSAESKVVDAEAIQVVLRAYGAKVRDAMRTTLGLLSLARGDERTYRVEGLDKFDTIPPDVLTELLLTALAEPVRVPSETFLTEVKHRLAVGLLPGIEQELKDKIRKEIEAGVKEDLEREDELHEIARTVGAGTPRGPSGDGGGRSAAAAPTAKSKPQGASPPSK